MSFSGKLTPLQLNALGSLKGAPVSASNPNGDPRGLSINSTGSGYHGTWSPTGYTAGTLTSPLASLTSAVKKLYTASITDPTLKAPYRSLLVAGSSCPALVNRRPASFKSTYAGYGSWSGGTKVEDNYPPRNYPITGGYSSIYTATGDYAWITGWPGRNSWQETVDTFKAATINTPEYDEYFSDGFIATIARQAYYEMWGGQFSQYQLITNGVGTAYSFKANENKAISSLISSKTFMSGSFSNVNDMSTGDISGVSLAFRLFGTDLLNLGRAIDLSLIHKLGLPSALLTTLQNNNVSVATKAVDLSLLMAGLSTQELINIKTPGFVPTKEQEQKIYSAFATVVDGSEGTDLSDVLFKLNCTTAGLTSLADLLNPAKMFPNSLNTLTVPKYNIDRSISTSGKIYYFIYVNGGVNSTQLQEFKQYFTVDLDGIIPDEIATACGALSMSLQQIKNIRSMDIQKFAPVVANMEVPNKNMDLLNQTNGLAVEPTVVDVTLSKQALGSGNGGQYRACDFFGAAAGHPYVNWYPQVQALINKLLSPTLLSLYTQLDAAANAPIPAVISLLITQINTEIDNIYSKYRSDCDELNFMWNAIGRQLMCEQRAIPIAIKDASNSVSAISSGDIDMFMSQLERYATDSGDGQTATILNNIADQSVVGGQSLVAAMREARNAVRLGLAGGELQNNVQNYIDPCAASVTARVIGGSITQVTVTNPSNGYNAAKPPKFTVYPVNVTRQAVLVPVLSAGGISSVTIVDGGEGYTQDTIHIDVEEPPQCQYTAPPQQSYNDTPYSQLVSPDLTAPVEASMTADEAIDSVTTCNCDCWLGP